MQKCTVQDTSPNQLILQNPVLRKLPHSLDSAFSLGFPSHTLTLIQLFDGT